MARSYSRRDLPQRSRRHRWKIGRSAPSFLVEPRAFPAKGGYKMNIFSTYTLTGVSPIANSSGSITYERMTPNIGLITFDDSTLGESFGVLNFTSLTKVSYVLLNDAASGGQRGTMTVGNNPNDLLHDSFQLVAANPDTDNVNFELDSRQSGSLAPISYTKGAEPGLLASGQRSECFCWRGRAAGEPGEKYRWIMIFPLHPALAMHSSFNLTLILCSWELITMRRKPHGSVLISGPHRRVEMSFRNSLMALECSLKGRAKPRSSIMAPD